MRAQRHTSALLFILQLSACTDQKISHPTPENIAPDHEIAAQIRKVPLPTTDPQLIRKARDLSAASASIRIGVLQGEQNAMFGFVQDIAVGADHSLYVLDSRYNDVRVFDKNGKIVNRFGGPGGGPNEFRSPKAIYIAKTGEVSVLDQPMRIKVFRLNAREFENVSTIELSGMHDDVCRLRDNVITASRPQDSSNVVKVHALSGAPVVSFHKGYISTQPLVQFAMNSGIVGCIDERDAVLYASTVMPYITAYSLTGERRWTSRFTEFIAPRIVEDIDRNGKVRVFVGYGDGGARHVPVTIESIGGGYALVQLLMRVQGTDGRDERRVLETYVIDVETGEGLYVSDSIPFIRAARPPFYYGFEIDPFPQVVILTAGEVDQ